MTRVGFSFVRRRRRRRVAWLAALVGVGVLAALVGPAEAASTNRPAAVTGLSVQAGDAPGELHVNWGFYWLTITETP